MVLLWALISATVVDGNGLELASEGTLEEGVKKIFCYASSF